MEAESSAVLSASDLGGWLVQAWAVQGHATQLISKLNGLAISGSTANTVLHMAMQVSHSLHRGENNLLSEYAAILRGTR